MPTVKSFRRATVAFAMVTGLLGASALSLSQAVTKILISPSIPRLSGRYEEVFAVIEQRVLIVGVVVIGISATTFLWLYLRGAFAGLTDFERTSGQTLTTQTSGDALRDLGEELQQIKAAQAATLMGDRKELLEALSPAIGEGLADALEARYSVSARDAVGLDHVRATFESSRRRLSLEIEALGRRATANVTIGGGTTFFALTVLGYMVWTRPEAFTDPVKLASHYVPWLTLVIFIEVFAFFFLRLYRATLVETRAYQDQLTDISLHQVAVEVAWLSLEANAKSALAKDILAGLGKRSAPLTTSDVDPKTVLELTKSLIEIAKKQKGSAGGADK